MDDAEAKAVNSLKRLAKRWPETLWLYSASGALCVMQKQNGERVYKEDGLDQDYVLEIIDIENDGGDW